MQLTNLLTSALMAAPIDTRRELLANIIVAGGRWGGWPRLADHIARRLEAWVSQTLPGLAGMVGARVVRPPEAGASVWIGGSILGSIMRSRVPYLSSEVWWERQRLLAPRGEVQAHQAHQARFRCNQAHQAHEARFIREHAAPDHRV
jgi:hypothetical protein